MRFLDFFRKNKKYNQRGSIENPTDGEQGEILELMGSLCEDGIDADELPNGHGEFGLSKSNPIPCYTFLGSSSYLDRLRKLSGARVKYSRRGSARSSATPMPIDIYEISDSNDQKLATIFISPYHRHTSNKAPAGFMLVD